MTQRRYPLLVVTCLTEFAALLVIFVVGRSLAEHRVSLMWMGMIGAAFGLSSSVSSLYFGWLSDRMSRRRGVMLGLSMALAGVGLAITGLGSLTITCISYVVVGTALGATYPVLSSWLTAGHNQGVSIRMLLRTLMGFSIAWNAGLIGAQLSGGWLFRYVSPASPLYLAVALLLVNLILVLSMPEYVSSDRDPRAAHDVGNGDRQQASTIFSQLSWIANIGGTFSMAMILHLLPALMVELGVGADQQGMLLAYNRVIVIGAYCLLFLTRFWHYRLSTAIVAQACGVAGLVMLGLAQGRTALLLGLTGVALLVGYNYFASLYYSSTRGSDEARGAAMGLHEASLAAGMTGGSALGGVLGTYAGAGSPYLLAAVVVVLLGAVQGSFWLGHRRRLGADGLDRLASSRVCA
ncbi:MAG: MFS transporter [Phycisphaerales bacterium]